MKRVRGSFRKQAHCPTYLNGCWIILRRARMRNSWSPLQQSTNAFAHNTILRRLTLCMYASSFCEEREKCKTMVILHPWKVIMVWLKCSLLFCSRIGTQSRLNLALTVLPSSLQTCSCFSYISLSKCWQGLGLLRSPVGMRPFWDEETSGLKLFKSSWYLRDLSSFFLKVCLC